MSLSFPKNAADRVALTSASASQSFRLDSVGDACFLIPGYPADRILKITWRAVVFDGFTLSLFDAVMLLFGHFGISLISPKNKTSVFETFHAVSRAGIDRLRWRRFIFGFFGLFAYIIILFAAVLFLTGCVSALFLFSPQASRGDWSTSIGLFLASLILTSGGLYAGRAFTTLRLPGSLKAIGRPPIDLHKIQILPLTGAAIGQPSTRIL